MPVKKIVINGGRPLVGDIKISGAKNSVLKQICSALLLKKGTLTLNNVPHLFDTVTLLQLMNLLGTKVTLDGDRSNKGDGKTIILDCSEVDSQYAPYEIVSKMRASFNVLGPLLSRFGKAKVSLPGGCAIGTRGFDIHFEALRKMGVNIEIEDGYVIANTVKEKVQGADVYFRFASVGATENVMMAAILAEGTTRIINPAKEAEIIDIANCLNEMGAKIKGAGTHLIEIEGVEELHSAEYTSMGDKIEAGCYMIAAIMTNGNLTLSGLDFSVLQCLIEKLEKIGANIKILNKNKIQISKLNIKRNENRELRHINIVTDVHPGFPTDLQAPIMALLAMVDGDSTIDETIFENRFMHVSELNRMNANIDVVGNKALIKGSENCYKSAKVMANDLRSSFALILAGLTAKGKTEVSRFYHTERGYEFVVNKINSCGGDVEVIYE
jgi:UDP-N-acetylglucosamine 1-carboxyvinyltransferase